MADRGGNRRLTLAALGAAAALLGALPAASGAAERTGRHLVVFEQPGEARSPALLSRVLERAGVQRAGTGVPGLGVATVRGGAAALARLREDPRVASVSAEWRRDLRAAPNDPALSSPETEFGGLPGGAPVQWWLARENFPAAWDVTTGAGAVVAVLDSGIEASHPELAPKIASLDEVATTSGAGVDADGHGSHVSGLACAATDNGVGIAGAGHSCRIAAIKIERLRDEDVVAGIDLAIRRGADAINMSFGGGGPNAALDLAIDRALDAGIVPVAAASNAEETDQGAPASQLQPGNAPDITAGRGLVVTAADFADQRAGTGVGDQISVAAYGFYDVVSGPPGLVSTYPAAQTSRETSGISAFPPFVLGPCECRRNLAGDARYAYLQGTSMATPQVAALAALVGDLNPALSAREKIRLIKETARRSGGWTPDLGWGIIDAGRAIDAARRIDRTAPSSRARAKRGARRRAGARLAAVRVRFAGRDVAGSTGLLPAGIATRDLFLRRGAGGFRRIRAAVRAKSLRLRLRPGVYRLFTQAIDRAGNREPRPARADVRVVVR